MDKMAELKAWQEKEYLPWKAAMAKYLDARAQQVAKLKRHVGDLQTIVAMLQDGRSKQAVTAWNALGLHPSLKRPAREWRQPDAGGNRWYDNLADAG